MKKLNVTIKLEETWSSTESNDVLNDILDMVESEDVAYEFVTH